jgi:hypothetical protein
MKGERRRLKPFLTTEKNDVVFFIILVDDEKGGIVCLRDSASQTVCP